MAQSAQRRAGRTEVRRGKTEGRGQMTEGRGREKTEVRDQRSEVRGQRTEVRGQRTGKDRSQRSEVRGQRTLELQGGAGDVTPRIQEKERRKEINGGSFQWTRKGFDINEEREINKLNKN